MEMLGSGAIAENSRPASVAIATATVDATTAAACCDLSHLSLFFTTLGRRNETASLSDFVRVLHNLDLIRSLVKTTPPAPLVRPRRGRSTSAIGRHKTDIAIASVHVHVAKTAHAAEHLDRLRLVENPSSVSIGPLARVTVSLEAA